LTVDRADGTGLSGALIDTIHSAAAAPVGALLVTVLTVTYADLKKSMNWLRQNRFLDE
jgi:hypothetical protein